MSGRVLVGVKRVIDYAVKVTILYCFYGLVHVLTCIFPDLTH